MSAISGYITQIQNAVYGEQVRTAIINALEACYSDVENPDLQSAAFLAAIEEAYDGGILDIMEVTQVSQMTNESIIYRYMGTESGYVANTLYYYDGTKWAPIGSGVTSVATAALMTDTSAIYKYTGSETGYKTNALYYYNGTAWTIVGSDVYTTFTGDTAGLVPAAIGKRNKKFYLSGAGTFETLPFSQEAAEQLIDILRSAVYDVDKSDNITALASALGVREDSGDEDFDFQYGQHFDSGNTGVTLAYINIEATSFKIIFKLDAATANGALFKTRAGGSNDLAIMTNGSGGPTWQNASTYPGMFSFEPSNIAGYADEMGAMKITYLNPSGWTSRQYCTNVGFLFNSYTPSAGFTLYRLSAYKSGTMILNLESRGTNGELYDTVSGQTYSFTGTSGMDIVEVTE